MIARLIRHRHYPWLAWALAAGFFLVEYVARIGPAVMAKELMRDFGVTAFGLGLLSSYFYYIYVGMQIPVGILVDRYGVRIWLTISAFLCVLACTLFSLATVFWVAALARLLIGLSAAFAFVSALKIARTWFPAHMLGFLAGTTQALGMLGAAFGEGPVAYSVDIIGWRKTMLVITAVVLVIACLIAFFVYDRPQAGEESELEAVTQISIKKGLSQVLRSKQTWLVAIFAGFIYAPSAAFAELWGVSFIHARYEFTMPVSANCIMFIFIGWAIGAPLFGKISDRMAKRLPMMRIAAVGSLACMSVVVYGGDLSVFGLSLLLLCYGVFNSGLALAYAYAGELHARQISGLSMALTNMASVLIGTFLQPLLGYGLDYFWAGGLSSDGVRTYSAENFQTVMLVFPVCFVIAILMTYMAKDTFCQGYEHRSAQSAKSAI